MSASVPAGVGRNGRPGAGSMWWLWLVPVAAMALLLVPGVGRDVHAAQQRRAWRHNPATPWILDAPRGARRTRPADLVVLVDESGSTSTSDPRGARWVQASELVRWMTRYDPADQITIGRFAGNAAPLDPLAPAATAAVSGPEPSQRDGTNFVPAVDQADQALARSGPRRQRVIVFITDGDGPDTSQALQRLDPQAHVYVFGLDVDGTWSKVRARWGTRVESLPIRGTAGSIAGAQVALLNDLTGQHVTAHQLPYPKGTNP